MSAMRNKAAPANIPMTDLNASKRLNFFLPQNNTPQPNGEDPLANYSLQGVMQWLNGEYRRYERERNSWEIERAKLVVLPLLFPNVRLKCPTLWEQGTERKRCRMI
jgi:Striatin family